MDDISDTQVDAPRSRSLRIRQTRVDYSEDDCDDNVNEIKVQSKEKKRGSKRKAELNIESLYCQENVKEVCPTSLETIFESPQKGLNRSRIKSVRNACILTAEQQLMSVKKWKRFCSFSDYYRPTKQKTKVRKDRAKKLKQLTGVKVPKGTVSDESLQTALAIISSDEEHYEIFEHGSSNKFTSSFYKGNIIIPDVEDSSVNDVIRNISSMQMVTEHCEGKGLISQDLIEDFNDSFLFSSEKENPKPLSSKSKKSRRRSEKFSGCLLSSSVNESHTIGEETVETVMTTPKRRNTLNDKKVVKKSKRLEPTLKRQNESKDEQCLKKRGNLKDGSVKGDLISGSTSCSPHSCENSSDIAINIPEYQSSADSSTIQLKQKSGGVVKGKKRSKRRVSGIERPLYRTIIEPASPEEILHISPNPSPNFLNRCIESDHNIHTPTNMTSPANNSPVQITAKTCPPTSPCTQMAALSLQTDKETASRNLSGNVAIVVSPEKDSLQTSQHIIDPVSSVVSVVAESFSVSHKGESDKTDCHERKSKVLDGMHKFTEIPKEKCDTLEKQEKKGRRLSSMFSQLELKNDSKEKISCGTVLVDALCNKKRDNVIWSENPNIKSLPDIVQTNLKAATKVKSKSRRGIIADNHIEESSEGSKEGKDCAVTENPHSSKLLLSKENCAGGVTVLSSPFTVKSEKNISSQCDKIKKFDKNGLMFEEDLEFNSPIITGMFLNKAGVRCGKVYRNRESDIESPVILSHIHNYQHKDDCPPES